LDDGGAVGGKDAGRDFDLMVEARVRKDFETGADGAAFGVVGTVDEALDTGLDNGAGAHAAGLDGDVESGIGKAVVAEEAGGFAQDDDFGVGGGVVVADGAIAGVSEDFAVVDKDGADGDFARGRSGAGFGEGFVHVLDVGFHLWREDSMQKVKSKN
jgi:hypothetical protein